MLAIAKLLVVVPIGSLNDRVNVKYLLLVGKSLYLICAVLYFFAGFFRIRELLLVATLLNGFASGITFTTYHSFYGKYSTKQNQAQMF